MEGDDVGAKHAEQDLLAPRHPGEDLGRRPGNVQEEPDGLIGPTFAQQPRDERQVVVVHPRDRSLAIAERGERRASEGGVHVLVAPPPAALKPRLLDGVVQQRPQGRVGESVVVLAHLGDGQADRQQPGPQPG